MPEQLDLVGALRMMAEEIQWTHDDRRAAVMDALDRTQMYASEPAEKPGPTWTELRPTEDDHN